MQWQASRLVRPCYSPYSEVHARNLEYGAAIRKAELRLSEYSMDEIDAIAVPLRKLAKFLHTLESITNSQSQFHISNIRQRFHAHTRSLKCMKVALEARLVALDEYEDACKVTQRKTQALERMGGNISASGPSPGLRNAAEMSLAELQQAKDNEGLARERLFYATSAIKENYGKVRSAQGEDMQRVLNDYVSNQLQCNREVMEAIEAWV
ncbi:hypothetical protein BC830DRAFT_159720 [Chytriomyces sp. MP71]|nr:hypothetical protein BC830DRAFT_159720 [Chytriomyces sp. MP71]